MNRQIHVDVTFVTLSSARLQEMVDLGLAFPHFADIETGLPPSNGGANCGPSVGVGTDLVGGAESQIAVMSENQQGSVPMPMVRHVPVVLAQGAQVYTNLGGPGEFQIAPAFREFLEGLDLVPLGVELTPLTATSNSAINYLLTDDAGRTQFILEAQMAGARTKVISAPRVLTLDNQSATIFVGTETPPYADLIEPFRSAVVQLDSRIPYVEVGVTLRVTPSIPQDNIIQLDIEPELRFVSAVVQDVFQLNGTVDSAVQVPILRTSQLRTTVLMNDGNTVIIGGLRDNTTMQTERGVPNLARIPLIGGYLFEHKQLDLRDELVLIVTAQIVRDVD